MKLTLFERILGAVGDALVATARRQRPADALIEKSGHPYLERWYLWRRGKDDYSRSKANLYLHVFNQDDDEFPHDHPWWSCSILLCGQLEEHFHDGTSRTLRPGSVRLRSPHDLHRLTISYGPAVTLFWRGRRRRLWGYLRHDGSWEIAKGQPRVP